MEAEAGFLHSYSEQVFRLKDFRAMSHFAYPLLLVKQRTAADKRQYSLSSGQFNSRRSPDYLKRLSREPQAINIQQ